MVRRSHVWIGSDAARVRASKGAGTMTKTVVIVGALDTKGAEFAFVKDLIERQGLRTLVVDFGVLGNPVFRPDVTRDEVSRAGGGDLAELRSGGHKDRAMQ